MADGDSETHLWLWVGLWGVLAVTIAGEGIFALIEGYYRWGALLTPLGLGGAVYIHRPLPTWNDAVAPLGIATAVSLVLGVIILWGHRRPSPPNRTSESSAPIGEGWLERRLIEAGFDRGEVQRHITHCFRFLR